MKHILQQIVDDSGEFTSRSYSGRGMYGKVCLGVTVDRDHTMGEFLALIIESVTDENQDELAEALRGLRTDSMGLGEVLYFPKVPYSAEEEDSEEQLECDDCGAMPGEPCQGGCPSQDGSMGAGYQDGYPRLR